MLSMQQWASPARPGKSDTESRRAALAHSDRDSRAYMGDLDFKN